ncbi:MAG: class I SAM-dependent methyltransferase [Verrucomicrobia bacterium]|nr:class I SAM-dependent methyltransferase [Verrucomicrobiota bacterium]
MPDPRRISKATVRDDFNDVEAVVHYTRAAHQLGLWESERVLIERFFPNREARLLEAGCGAGRVCVALWELGYRRLHAFDFADELLTQARSLAVERGAAIEFFAADATRLGKGHAIGDTRFDGALFLFNGLMQIPLRRSRRRALRALHAVCRPGAPLLFTTHDRDSTPTEQALWRLEALRWVRGERDPRLREFGDRYFTEEGTGRTFMHLPDRTEILEDLAATGWEHAFDAIRPEVAAESRAVRDFSDDCRFWLAKRAAGSSD